MGTKTNNTIQIDGQRYDSVSGAPVADTSSQAYHIRHPRPSVDGFRPIRHGAAPTLHSTQQRHPHAPAHHVMAHKPIPSQTLMRTAVKKPVIQSPALLRAQSRTDILARTPGRVVAPKVSYGAIDPQRLKKATQMVQNPAVSHYGPVEPVRPLAVSPAPAGRVLDNFSAPARTAVNTYQLTNIPVEPVRDLTPQPNMFEQAVARATSHEQTFDDHKLGKRRKGRIALAITVAACLLLAVGTLAYMNIPAISLRVASSRAGFHAVMPNYNPVGYSFGTLSYGRGNVTISYKSGAAHTYDITQRTSDWDSQALLTNFVASANKSYQTYERAGRTIYFFGDNTATWVDNGIWYTVNGNNSLTKSQLLDLASSI